VDVYTTEEEQLAALKKWFKDNWRWMLTAIGVFLFVFFGKQYIEQQQIKKNQNVFGVHAEVTSLRQELMTSLKENPVASSAQQKGSDEKESDEKKPATTEADTIEVAKNAYLQKLDVLKKDYSKHKLTQLAVLSGASALVEAADYTAAEKELRWLVNNNPAPELIGIVKLRLGQVLFQIEKYDEALKVTQQAVKSKSGYEARTYELIGDIYTTENKFKEALAAYKQAQSAKQTVSNNQALQWKIDDLANAQ